MAHDIFLCYSRADRVVADTLVARLRAENWSVFQDVNTHVGKRWHKEIERELRAARAVVVLWSSASRDSDFVLEEAEYGKREGILFPAFIERVELPYGFSRIQTADLVDWVGKDGHPSLDQLLEALSMQLGDIQQAKAAPPAGPASELPASGTTFRDSLKDGGEGPLMVVIPAGRFLMGSPTDESGHSYSEGPQHKVRIATPFAMGVHAVTFDDYERFTRATGAPLPDDRRWGRGKRPVINVSWNDAQAYCTWLGEQSGYRYRLPSEAEWEYACRAGTIKPSHFDWPLPTDPYIYSDKMYVGSATGAVRDQTLPVGSFRANAFGLHDMYGNVWEWCQDRWNGNYDGAPDDGLAWEAGVGENTFRMLRGGQRFAISVIFRAADRLEFKPDSRGNDIGFRVCRGSPI